MIHALSGDRHFLEILTHKKMTGYVHSTFKRTINIVCLDDNQLYTVASSDIDNAPNTLILDCASMDGSGIGVDDEVYSDGIVFRIGNSLSIDVSDVEAVELSLPTFPRDADRIRRNVAIMKKRIEEVGESGGIKGNATSESPFELEVSKMLSARTELLVDQLSSGRLREAGESANSILGLGPGLTPSGDDYLTGMIAVFMVPNHPIPELHTFCEEVATVAKTATNIISYSAIFQASKGKIRASLVHLLACLFTGEEEELLPALEAVLAIGSTSGTDMALGIVAGIELTMKIGGNL
ncbi:DUF2877 domain-containing protein [Sporosarcina sp. A2]|uniref:DUF2877 domain-containing protein n=1 Tax=Sporosarcina sp. A2 TaxID=3393449 RepID=UPI003D7A17B5